MQVATVQTLVAVHYQRLTLVSYSTGVNTNLREKEIE